VSQRGGSVSSSAVSSSKIKEGSNFRMISSILVVKGAIRSLTAVSCFIESDKEYKKSELSNVHWVSRSCNTYQGHGHGLY
jgi:hypothetical protein